MVPVKLIHLSIRADDILWLNALYDAHGADEEGGRQHPEHQDEENREPRPHAVAQLRHSVGEIRHVHRARPARKEPVSWSAGHPP